MQFCFIFPGLNLPFVFIGSQSSFRSIYHKEATILFLSENYWVQEECNKADLPYRCQSAACRVSHYFMPHNRQWGLRLWIFWLPTPASGFLHLLASSNMSSHDHHSQRLTEATGLESLGSEPPPVLVICCCSDSKSCPTPCDPRGLQPARFPCPSLSYGICSNSCPFSWWCHPTISSSAAFFSSHLQSFPASGSFPMSQFFTSGG